MENPSFSVIINAQRKIKSKGFIKNAFIDRCVASRSSGLPDDRINAQRKIKSKGFIKNAFIDRCVASRSSGLPDDIINAQRKIKSKDFIKNAFIDRCVASRSSGLPDDRINAQRKIKSKDFIKNAFIDRCVASRSSGLPDDRINAQRKIKSKDLRGGGSVNKKERLADMARISIVEADEDRAMEVIALAMASSVDVLDLLTSGFAAGNREIGELFENGRITLPELLFSSEVMEKAMEKVESLVDNKEETVTGKVLIATVDGDVHDIGKGIVISTMRSYGIKVIDLGREVPVDVIIEKAKEHQVDIIGTSALLTSTLKEQKKLEDALRKMGIREQFKTMVGGAPCTMRWAKRIGADFYTEHAVEAAMTVLELLSQNDRGAAVGVKRDKAQQTSDKPNKNTKR